ncbi:restriction endonuclease subunit S [Psychrobacter sp. UBA2514]|uniref:restriction endonuclease subunit S n=1 Tax=Psychrobacter sp. UBA2514 TaxID=1947346 RepID=UPI00257C2B7B|nr:restriction endonuclease subunit S [Psychrobacter sp. UBA2514]|tara:strand:+ start:371 stop:1567 length:1197 start_codon:yes stop_codon:yes gene_type:complete
MSELSFMEKLLDGVEVEWIALGGGVVEFQRGKRLVRSQLEESGKYAVFQNSMKPLGYYHESNVEAETAFIICAGAAGEIGYSKDPFWAADDVYFAVTPELVNSKYLYHFLLTQKERIEGQVRRASIPRLSKSAIEKLELPIPCPDMPEKSLEIQSEIVRILDTFTELTAELTAELSLRKKQYNHYRDQLLSFEEGEVEWKTLGWIGDVRMCKRIMKNQTSDSGDIPFFKIGTFGKEPDAYISRDVFEEYKERYSYPRVGEILISASGTIGRAVIFNGEDAYFQDSNIVWLENDESKVLNKYLFYFYQIASWNVSDGGVIKRLYNDNIKKTLIPIPFPNDPEKSLAEQARVVEILDKFDILTTSISEGLPREIELRQKQYEYYRDLLLSFPKSHADEAA